VLPTYDERDSVAPLLAVLRAQLGPVVRILVVDDGSPDGPVAIVREVAARDSAVELLSRRPSCGWH